MSIKSAEDMLAKRGRVYRCNTCTNYSGERYVVEDHVLRSHINREEAPFRCRECKTLYKNRKAAERHMAKHPTEEFQRMMAGTHEDLQMEGPHTTRLDRESSLAFYNQKLGKSERPSRPSPAQQVKKDEPASHHKEDILHLHAPEEDLMADTTEAATSNVQATETCRNGVPSPSKDQNVPAGSDDQPEAGRPEHDCEADPKSATPANLQQAREQKGEDSGSDSVSGDDPCVPLSTVGMVVRETLSTFTQSMLETQHARPSTTTVALSRLITEQMEANTHLKELGNQAATVVASLDQGAQSLRSNQGTSARMIEVMEGLHQQGRRNLELQEKMFRTFIDLSTKVLEHLVRHELALEHLATQMLQQRSPAANLVEGLLGIPKDTGAKRELETDDVEMQKKQKC